jgi:CTP synthase
VGRENSLFVHLTLVPYIGAAGELKTKPTQHSVKLRAIGIQPDILLCRTDRFLSKELKAKIALFCSVDEDAVITAKDVDSIYEVPAVLGAEGLDEIILKQLNLPLRESDLSQWQQLIERIKHPADEVQIAIVGKYVEFEESYKSLKEALVHAGLVQNLRTVIRWIEAEGVDGEGWQEQLRAYDGILVPGGFGKRGIEGVRTIFLRVPRKFHSSAFVWECSAA